MKLLSHWSWVWQEVPKLAGRDCEMQNSLHTLINSELNLSFNDPYEIPRNIYLDIHCSCKRFDEY